MGITASIDISAEQRQLLLGLIKKHLPNTLIWAFGSRVKWTTRFNSDLDLVAFASPQQDQQISALKEAFEESNLPFRVDLLVWDKLPENFQRNIQERYEVLVEANDLGRGLVMSPDRSSVKLENETSKLDDRLHETPTFNQAFHLIDSGDDCMDAGGRAMQGAIAGKQTPTNFQAGVGVRTLTPTYGADWPTVKLADIVGFKTGKLDSNQAEAGGVYPFFTCSPITYEINTYAFDTEAVLLAGNNASGVFSVKYYKGKFNAYQRTYVITPLNSKQVSVRWLYFRIKQITSELQQLSIGTSTKFLTKKILDAFQVSLPSLDEQEVIADILWSLQDKLDNNRQTNQTLEQIAQAIFKSWFVDFEPVNAKMAAKQAGASAEQIEQAAICAISGKTPEQLAQLDPQTLQQLKATAALFPDALVDSELGEIPEGWKIGPLSDIAVFADGRIDVSELSLENYISTENMLEDKKGISIASSLPNVKSVPNFNIGQILISNIRPYFKKIWLARFEGGRSNDVLGLAPIDSNCVEFLYNLLYQDEFFNFMMATSKGAKMPRGDKSAIMGWICIQPSLEIKTAYAKNVEVFYKRIDSTTRENEYLESLRDSLLPKLLSGELSIDSSQPCSEQVL